MVVPEVGVVAVLVIVAAVFTLLATVKVPIIALVIVLLVGAGVVVV